MGKEYFKVTPEMEQEWKENNLKHILFDVDCGLGKTQAVLDLMKEHPTESMLYLVPRIELLKSIENRAKKDGVDNIKVMTIQDLYYVLKRLPDAGFLLCGYQWVCIDEAQQAILDAPFNKTIGMTINMIVNAFKGTLLMLTGTDVGIADVFQDAYGIEVKTYRKKEAHASWLTTNSFAFVPNIDTVVNIIDRATDKGEKVLFFSSTIENIDKVSEMISAKSMAVVSKYSKHSTRLCGRNRKHVNKLIEDEMIPENCGVVMATKCMDVGTNIRNGSVIIVDSLEIATAIQEINRRRREDDETVDVYFLLPNSYKISNNITKYEKELKDYALYCNDLPAWQQKHKCERISEKGIIYTVPNAVGEGAHYEVDFYYLQYIHYMFKTAFKNEKVSGYKSAVEQALGVPSVTLTAVGRKHWKNLLV